MVAELRRTVPAPTFARQAGWMSVATLLVSACNYAYSLVVVRLLQPKQFSRFAAGQSMLLVVANGALAAVPWAVARYIARENRHSARHEALCFGLAASLIQAAAAAFVTAAVLVGITGFATAAVAASGAFLLAGAAGTVGYLQGTDQIVTLARLRISEAGLRIATGLLAVLALARSGALALIGFPVGGAFMLAMSVRACRDALPLRRPDRQATRLLIRHSAQLGSVQLLLCALAALDAVEALASGFPAAETGGYQVAALVGRLPFFISAGVAIAAYTQLTRARDDHQVSRDLRRVLRFYLLLATPVLVACWALPPSVLRLVVPDGYASTAVLLRYTSLSSFALGLVNCLTTAHQARGRFRSAIVILLVAAVCQPVLLISLGSRAGVTAFSRGLVALSSATLAAIVWDSRRWLRRPPAGVENAAPSDPLPASEAGMAPQVGS